MSPCDPGRNPFISAGLPTRLAVSLPGAAGWKFSLRFVTSPTPRATCCHCGSCHPGCVLKANLHLFSSSRFHATSNLFSSKGADRSP
ncbi:hypothetical protein DTO271D3_9142 [Paecilomyces variotii]|nr:hypothetical protein DTO217A2_8043 [Paecilomyces variotii]KAJ9310598.1 hypothetical protein DTO271D3_9142 [Paecilomyces variotii]